MCQHLASLHGYGPVLDALGRKIDPAALAALTSGLGGREGIIDCSGGERNPPALAAGLLEESGMRRILCPLCSPGAAS